MLDPSIALSVKPPSYDPLAAAAQFQRSLAANQQMAEGRQQLELNAQKIEEGKTAVQAAAQKAADQKITLAAFQRANGVPADTVKYAIAAGASPDAIMSLQKHDADQQEKYAKIASDQLGTRKYQNEQMLGLHQQALGMDPQTLAQNWPQIYAQAVKIDPEAAKHLDPNTPPNADQLKMSQAGYATDAFYLTQAEEKRKQAAEGRAQAGEQRASAMAGPQLAKATAEAAAANRQQDASMLANALKQGTGAFTAAMSQLPPDRRAPFTALTAQAKPEDVLAIGETPHEQVTAAETAKRDAATAVNEAAMRAAAAGHLGVAQAEYDLKKKTFEQTFGPNSNPSLQGVEPHLRVAAASGAQKITDEYQKAIESTANMQSIIDLARSGNKVAYAYAPTTGVMTINTAQGQKRVNIAELKAYGGAGSALNNIEGFLGKQVSGASIPKDILANMESVNKTIADNATSSGNAKMDAHNGIYRSSFKLAPALKASGGGTIRARDPQGKLHEAPAGTALPTGWTLEK